VLLEASWALTGGSGAELASPSSCWAGGVAAAVRKSSAIAHAVRVGPRGGCLSQQERPRFSLPARKLIAKGGWGGGGGTQPVMLQQLHVDRGNWRAVETGELIVALLGGGGGSPIGTLEDVFKYEGEQKCSKKGEDGSILWITVNCNTARCLKTSTAHMSH